MKKRLLLFYLMALPFAFIHAEHSQTLSQEIPSNQSALITATDHILLSPGFRFEPKNGSSVRMEIDAFDTAPPLDGVTGGPADGDNGVVGTLKGTVDVSSLGAATYTIPIDLPNGLGGLVPQLGIYYNNQQRNGLLGWNWDLSGISFITRTGSTWYHDGYLSAVNHLDDRFCLDGQRLMKVSTGNYGGDQVEYRTEQDQMNKIVSYHVDGVNGTGYFKVWTADGKILSYGNTEDSRALKDSSNYINIWLLKSVEDHNGNMITYHYLTKEDSYRVIRIDYSENIPDDLDPAFKVYFNYDLREDVELSYQGNCLLRHDVVLENISIMKGNHLLYDYDFEYRKPDPPSGYPYHLLTSIRKNASGQHYNPTKITWGDNNYNIPMINTTDIPVSPDTDDYAFANSLKFSGDFNGDGFTDVVVIRPRKDGSGTYDNHAELYLNCGYSNKLNFRYAKSFALNEFINWIYVADFNGDGCDDLLLTDRHRTAPPYPDLISSTVFLSRGDYNGTLSFAQHDLPSYPIKSNLVESLLIGDFIGDGKPSILIQSLKNDKDAEKSVLIRYINHDEGFQLLEFQEHLPATRFYTSDFNGDGATDILYKNEQNHTSIATLRLVNDTPHFLQIYRGTPGYWDDCFPGDYNGDGYCDILFHKENDSFPWFIILASSTGLSKKQYDIASFPYESPGNYHFSIDHPNETYQHIKVGDFDGNGCSDMALYKDNTLHLYFGPVKPNNSNTPFAYQREIDSQHIHYFSNMDISVGNFLGKENLSFLGNYSASHLPPLSPRHEVTQITDGMGVRTEFQYDYLIANPNNPSENDFYYPYTFYTNPFLDVHATTIPMRALKKVTTFNINNKPETVECQFQGALVHRKGKGFLGFAKTIQKNSCNNIIQQRIERTFDLEYCGQAFHPFLQEEKTFDKQERLVAKASCLNRIYANHNNPLVYKPITDKTICEYDIDHPGQLIKKEINETVINQHCDNPYEYHGTISVTQVIKGITDNPNITLTDHCEYYTKTITTHYADMIDKWLINRPKNVTEIIHHDGDEDICHKKSIFYDSSCNHLISSLIEYPNGETTGNHPLNKKTTYQYDLTGNIISKTIVANNDSNTARTELFEYGRSNGRRVMTKHTNAKGQVTQFKYHPIYDHLTSVVDCNQRETIYEQDPFGTDRKTQRPDGTTTSHALRWGSNGIYQWEKSTGQATKVSGYALTGENTHKQGYALNGEPTKTEYTYDDYGRMDKETMYSLDDRSFQTIKYEYDGHHRVKTIRHFDGTHETLNYDGNCSSASYHTLDGDQQTESKTVNARGWVIRSTDASGNSVIYDYYPDGKVKWTQIEGHDETRIEFQYDALGNRISVLDPDYGLITEEYNAFGELIRRCTPDSVTTEYTYDKLGNKTRRVETDNKSGLSSVTEWTYGTTPGTNGLLMRIKHDDQIIYYEYDSMLHLTAIIEERANGCYKTLYTYDKASRVESTSYPSGFTVHYVYTSEGQLRCITDNEGKTLWRQDEVNALGVPTRFRTGDGAVTYHEYDPANNKLLSIKTVTNEKVIQNHQYSYDDYGNMTARTDNRNGISEHFAYDHLNRLVSATGEQGESVFDYDPLGRMTRKTKNGQTVFSNADYTGPMPHAIKSAETQEGVFPTNRMSLQYTPFGKVASITEGENSVTFHYGFDHQRIRSLVHHNGKVFEKNYVGECEFITQPGLGITERTFLSCPTGVFAVVETKNGNTEIHYIHKDHLGSWTTITDSKGNIEQEKHFDAWGNCANPDSLLFDRGYTGHEHIRGMNLINMNGRVYDPTTSSMISPDANIQTPDFTQNFNRYAYCMNNPLSYVDPDGNSFIYNALLFYVIFCTDYGYEIQKELLPFAVHLDLHLSSEQLGLGVDVSLGVPKEIPLSIRFHGGATYYWKYYDNSFKGWEFRTGVELCGGGMLGVSGTTYYFDGKKQVTNTIFIGNSLFRMDYENDYMFNICEDILGFPKADNGDRYRTAAAKIRYGLFSIGMNLFTGDPGKNDMDRRTYIDPSNNRETYTISANGEDPDEFRAGVLYFGAGPLRVGWNSEGIRNFLQNRLAHDWLCNKSSPYFKELDRPGQFYFHFGSPSANSLW